MLKSWSIENFKPIINSGELKLAPVTVLAGRNSSGKSSLLQSILMIAQTLGNQIPDRALLPNERIVQLGTFEDILNENSNLRNVMLSFELDFETEDEETKRLRRKTKDVDAVKVSATFGSAKGNGTTHSAIEASKVSVENVSLKLCCEYPSLNFDAPEEDPYEEFELRFSLKKMKEAECRDFLKEVLEDYLRLLPYPEEEHNYKGEFASQDGYAEEPYLVTLSHFLPTRLVKKYDIETNLRVKLERLIHRLFSKMYEFMANRLSSQLPEINMPISEDLKNDVQALCKEKKIANEFSGQSIRELANWYLSLKGVQGGRKAALGKKLQTLIVETLIQERLKTELGDHKGAKGLEITNNSSNVTRLEQAVEEITRFFTSQIRYLGPLRADPQSSQKFAPSSELDDIGTKGEYAAAVFDANQNAHIEWYNPDTGQTEQGTLKKALDTWARYLGVANQVRTEMAGASGVTWKVVLKENYKARTLPEVGVGVSQVLPILVMGLLSPQDTLLILEQPELHLHASIQARLGDFFVGLSKCKKQCIIETHSENLVSQLRYHIVQSGGQEESGCMIYFVYQDDKGSAKFEPIEISARGNIMNWPDGFFDETMHQEDRINAASIRRRAKLASNG